MNKTSAWWAGCLALLVGCSSDGDFLTGNQAPAGGAGAVDQGGSSGAGGSPLGSGGNAGVSSTGGLAGSSGAPVCKAHPTSDGSRIVLCSVPGTCETPADAPGLGCLSPDEWADRCFEGCGSPCCKNPAARSADYNCVFQGNSDWIFGALIQEGTC